MKKIELNIKGMHCNSCTVLIKDALEEHKGVQNVNVDLKKNKAVLSYDEKITNEKQLIETVKNEGYEATLAK